MKPYQIVDRLKLMYGDSYPLLSDLDRVVNTEELSSIFVLSNYLLGKEHRGTVQALMNLVYEREDDENIFVLFKVLNEIKDNEDALDAFKFRMDALGYVANEVPEYSLNYGVESIHTLSISIDNPIMPNDVYSIIPRYIEKMKYKLNTSILPVSESSPEDISSLAGRFYN